MKSLSHLLLLFIFCSSLSFAQSEEVWFQPNKGQWNANVLYKVDLQKGEFIIEKDKFTYALYDLSGVHEAAHHNKEPELIPHHTIYSHFINSSWGGEAEESDTSLFYQNYILGNDSTKWQPKVYNFRKLELIDYYPGIDLILETFSDKIKYSFRVYPGVDPSIIKIFHEGMNGLNVSDDQVEIYTRFGPIIENELKVWQESADNEREHVQAKFSNHQDTVFFELPNGYDATKTLIIDPSLTFSTFTGSTSDNWGFTAAPDNDGNLYAGGIVFGTGYPVTAGAYDEDFNGGTTPYKIDMGITKFSPDGTQLLYSTYIGGSGNETPNSIITNAQGELYILGITSSGNFPTTANAYQTYNKGGGTTTQIAIKFTGTDIVVCKLSSDGSDLLASTYLGGGDNDGLNLSSLNYNYGDVFRGEIILDHNNDVVFTSSTQSQGFPIVNGANATFGGNQDGVVVKMNPTLTDIIWSTFIGGSSDDSGFSLQVSSTNNLFVTGGTKSTNLPFSGGYKPTFQGGSADGYVLELDGTTSEVLNGTYIGSSSYDQSFFVQLDQDDNVYVFGQTDGNIAVTPNKYTNPNSGQFIQKYSTDLSNLEWSTIVGGGNGVVEISPTAFLVSNCNEIYFTGWGGTVNQSVQATQSTSVGFPTTSDAYQSNTNGSNFYIGVLSADAEDLVYGTFMGGVASSSNHVDGGTSRFDKHGSIYHAVCGACGGNQHGFSTTPGVWSETNNSTNCNMAAWKFDLYGISAIVSVPDATICLPDSVFFSNNSQNGTQYYWDFGDGSTSTEFEPNHYYENTGTYDVMLVVSDESGCTIADTAYVTVEILNFTGGDVVEPGIVCPGESYQLEASGGSIYHWSPEEFLDDPTSATPIATIDSTTEFTVSISNGCGAEILHITLEMADISSSITDDMEICKGDTIQLNATGGGTYLWEGGSSTVYVGSNEQASILVAPESSTNFTVNIESPEGCVRTESVYVKVYQDVPFSILEDTLHICQNAEVEVTVLSDAETYLWYPDIDISATDTPTILISTIESRWYYVDLNNPCGTNTDSVFIEVVNTFPEAGNDTIVCPRETVDLWASGGISYQWSPAYSVNQPNEAETFANPNNPTIYTVTIVDEFGCIDSATVKVDHFPEAGVYTNPDYYGFSGDEVNLLATGNSFGGEYTWFPEDGLSCSSCQNPTANPTYSTTYFVTFTDKNGCKATDEVNVNFETLFYVPNTFTPDGNEFNNMFFAYGGNISEFKMMIFNRWGELIFESHDINQGWDGTYGDKICKDGTYVWKINYKDLEGTEGEMVGHVNLLR